MNRICVHFSTNRKFKKMFLLFCLIKVGLFLLLVWNCPFSQCNGTSIHPESNSPSALDGYKHILIWNIPDRTETATFGFGHLPFVQRRCKISKCAIFDKTSSFMPFEEYDAIIVNMLYISSSQLPRFKRKAHQRYIFLTQEPPPSMPTFIASVGNYFNWTMTYKLNSDIQLLYGRIEPGPTAPKTTEETLYLIGKTRLPSAKNYAANKTSPVAWIVSHCYTYSSRETYANELSKYIPVDIYGKCGKSINCNRNQITWFPDPECYDMMEAKYKFYLSFENSICSDYVTEKFFEILSHDIIPVVYGGANYSHIAPHHSYINALDFTSPEELAQYLKLLDSNDTLYNEYFWWKDHYRVEVGIDQMARHGFCDLCKKLHQDEGVVKYYSESELVSNWHLNTQCRQLTSWSAHKESVLYRLWYWFYSLFVF